MSKLVAALPLAVLLAVLAGCGGSGHGHFCTGASTSGCTQVPRNAAKADFCAAGARFSEVQGFANGLKAARALAAVGTPSNITPSARAGFVELVERMVDAKNGPDFRSRTRSLPDPEKKHLLDLDTYIGSTC